MSKPTEINQFMNDLDGGVFTERMGRILSEVAAGVMDHGKAGKVTIDFNIKRVADTYQVHIDHKVTYKRPTARGDISENNVTATLMHVDVGGERTEAAELNKRPHASKSSASLTIDSFLYRSAP